jgi:hypothetical protein
VIPGDQVVDLGDDIFENHQLEIAGAAGAGLLGRLQRHIAGELARGGLPLVLGEEVEIEGGQVDLVVELLAADHRGGVAQVDFLSQIVNYEDPSLDKLSIFSPAS